MYLDFNSARSTNSALPTATLGPPFRIRLWMHREASRYTLCASARECARVLLDGAETRSGNRKSAEALQKPAAPPRTKLYEKLWFDDSTTAIRALKSAAALSLPIYSVAVGRRQRSARADRKSIEKPREDEDEAEVSRPRGEK